MKKFILTYPIEIIFCFLFIVLAAIINIQFLEGANINNFNGFAAIGTNGGFVGGQDEYLSVREVYSIIHPQSFKHFILSIISGDIWYYGRVVFYTDALIAYIPFKIWGIDGLVYSVRMTHSIWIIVSLLLLGTNFLKTNISKTFFYFITSGFLYTFYYVQMPKPEPIQLFFLILFFIKWHNSNYKFGYWFIWLGLAYAAKFNIIVIFPLIFIFYLMNIDKPKIKSFITDLFKSMLWFICGLIIGIPSLILTPFKKVYLETYLHETILATPKPYDDKSLTILTWVENGIGEIYFGFPILGYLFFLMVLLITILLILKYKTFKNRDVLFILLAGLILIVSILLFTKRLWPHYVWTGIVLIYLGFWMFYEQIEYKMSKKICLLFLVLFSLSSTFKLFYKTLPYLLNEERSLYTSKNRKNDTELYKYLELNYLNRKIGISADVYYPYKYFVISNIYHPFSSKLILNNQMNVKIYSSRKTEIWESDVVVYSNFHPRKIQKENQIYDIGNSELLNKFYNEMLLNYFQEDTCIGRYKIYVRNEFKK